MGVVKPPHIITVANTIVIVAETIIGRDSLYLGFRIANVYAIAPLNPEIYKNINQNIFQMFPL